MAVIRKPDAVTVAVSKAARATTLFTKASDELDAANALLAAAIVADQDQMQQLHNRVVFAQTQVEANTKVATKLKEFAV